MRCNSIHAFINIQAAMEVPALCLRCFKFNQPVVEEYSGLYRTNFAAFKIAEAMRDRNYHLRKEQKSNSTYH